MSEQKSEPVVASKVSVEQMAAELLPQISSAIKLNPDKFNFYADGGEEKGSFWFEVWEFRGHRPPRMVFASPQQYNDTRKSLVDAMKFINCVLGKEYHKLIISCRGMMFIGD